MSSPPWVRLVPEDDGATNIDHPNPVEDVSNPVNANVIVSGLENLINISSNNDDDEEGNEDDVHEIIDDISSDTSATSIASALSDGAPRPRSTSLAEHPTGYHDRASSTPRSTSNPRASSARASSNPRSSTPRSRPRSNPRTRTPMRHESPLLVMVRGGEGYVSPLVVRESVVVADGGEGLVEGVGNAIDGGGSNTDESNTERDGSVNIAIEENERVVRSIFNTRYLMRSLSIREEEAEVESITENVGELSVAQPSNSRRSAAGHWLSRTIHASTTTNAATTTHRSQRINTPSTKQRPSHRKLRRWNNDRFIGTHSESIHNTVLLNEDLDGDEQQQYWKEFWMPNYPREYRSEFARLATDDTKHGQLVRDRFVKGEVPARHRRVEMSLEDSIAAKFHKMGVALESNSSIMGKALFGKLSPRIQSVLSRSCSPRDELSLSVDGCVDTTASTMTFAGQVVSAFETYLVSLALTKSKKDVSSLGYPPEQPQQVYDLFGDILASPPHVVLRKKTRKSSKHETQHPHGLLIPTIHFYFPATNSIGSNTKQHEEGHATSSAFYRILLYAVCEFHGLVSSSTFMTAKRAEGRRGNGSEEGVKVVTVQGGLLMAPSLKLLDYIDTCC